MLSEKFEHIEKEDSKSNQLNNNKHSIEDYAQIIINHKTKAVQEKLNIIAFKPNHTHKNQINDKSFEAFNSSYIYEWAKEIVIQYSSDIEDSRYLICTFPNNKELYPIQKDRSENDEYVKQRQDLKIYIYDRCFGNIDLIIFRGKASLEGLVDIWDPKRFNENTGNALEILERRHFINIARYLDHGQCLNTFIFSKNLFEKLKKDYKKDIEDYYKQYIQDVCTYAKNNKRFFLEKNKNKKYLVLHQTTAKDKIVKSGQLRSASGGCMGSLVYTTELIHYDDKYLMGGHGVGINNRFKRADKADVEEINSNKFLLIEVDNSKNNNITNIVERFGFGMLWLKALYKIEEDYYKIIDHSFRNQNCQSSDDNFSLGERIKSKYKAITHQIAVEDKIFLPNASYANILRVKRELFYAIEENIETKGLTEALAKLLEESKSIELKLYCLELSRKHLLSNPDIINQKNTKGLYEYQLIHNYERKKITFQVLDVKESQGFAEIEKLISIYDSATEEEKNIFRDLVLIDIKLYVEKARQSLMEKIELKFSVDSYNPPKANNPNSINITEEQKRIYEERYKEISKILLSFFQAFHGSIVDILRAKRQAEAIIKDMAILKNNLFNYIDQLLKSCEGEQTFNEPAFYIEQFSEILIKNFIKICYFNKSKGSMAIYNLNKINDLFIEPLLLELFFKINKPLVYDKYKFNINNEIQSYLINFNKHKEFIYFTTAQNENNKLFTHFAASLFFEPSNNLQAKKALNYEIQKDYEKIWSNIKEQSVIHYKAIYPLLDFLQKHKFKYKTKCELSFQESQQYFELFKRFYTLTEEVRNKFQTALNKNCNIINNVLFEALKDYILLNQQTDDALAWEEVHSFDLHNQYQIFFNIIPDLGFPGDWDTGTKFQPKFESIEDSLNKHAVSIGTEETKGYFSLFLMNRIAYYINIACLKGTKDLPSPENTLNFEILAEKIPNLAGILARNNTFDLNPKESLFVMKFQEYFTDLFNKAYDKRGLYVLRKNGLAGKEEIGIRRQSDDLNIKIFNPDIKPDSEIGKSNPTIEQAKKNGFKFFRVSPDGLPKKVKLVETQSTQGSLTKDRYK